MDDILFKRPTSARQCTHLSMLGTQCYNRAIVTAVKRPNANLDTQAQDLCSQCLEVAINRMGPNDEILILRI